MDGGDQQSHVSGCSATEAKGTESTSRKNGVTVSAGESDQPTASRTRMYLLWFLGDLPAPQIFLNVSAAHKEDSVSFRCTLSSDFPVTMVFLCKDGRSIASQRLQLHDASYTWVFQISEQSAGQYSCGYKIKDKPNQEKTSALSPPEKLTVHSSNDAGSSGNSRINMSYWIPPVVCVVVLILATLIYFLVKKGASHRSPREQGLVMNRSNPTFEENIQYASIVGLQNTRPPPLRNAETPYAAISPLKQMSGLHCEPDSQPSWNT